MWVRTVNHTALQCGDRAECLVNWVTRDGDCDGFLLTSSVLKCGKIQDEFLVGRYDGMEREVVFGLSVVSKKVRAANHHVGGKKTSGPEGLTVTAIDCVKISTDFAKVVR